MASFLEVYDNVFSVLLRVVKSLIFFTDLQSNSEKILNMQLVKFQLFYLLFKWFPNSTVAVVDPAGHSEGIQVAKRLSQGSLKHKLFYTSRHFENRRNYFKIKLQPCFVGGTAFNCLIRLSTLLKELANFCLLADVLLVFQTIFTICI